MEEPMDVDFPYYYSLEETVSVCQNKDVVVPFPYSTFAGWTYFNFGTGFSRLVGPFSSTGSIPGSASYEVHRGALSQNALSPACKFHSQC